MFGNSLTLGIQGNGDEILMTPEMRSTHLLVTGGTGTGKSKLLESLIQDDILQWPKCWPTPGCGPFVLDPDGKLFDDLMWWLASQNMQDWPIVPVDLRRKDLVTGYNPIRPQPGMDPAALIGSRVQAMLHAWGQSSTTETPTLSKVLTLVLRTLYDGRYTLADALDLLNNPSIRKQMVAKVKDPVSRSVWAGMMQLKETEFQEEVKSTMNRLVRFLETEVIRSMLSHPGASLDFSEVIEKGKIVLVSLATSGGTITAEDANTLGSLMLSDLWTAATLRGKRDEDRPYYVFIDEFQRFLTPAIADSLDRARGYNLHFTFANQFPSQLLLAGPSGERIYHSVMANARSKAVFQLSHPNDLEYLATAIFRQELDPNKVKHVLNAKKVVDHALEYVPTWSATEGEDDSRSEQESTMDTITGTSAASYGAGDDESSGLIGDPAADADALALSGQLRAMVVARSAATSSGNGYASGHTHSTSKSRTDGVVPMLTPVMGTEVSSVQFSPLEEQLHTFMRAIDALPKRHFVVRFANEWHPHLLVTPYVSRRPTMPSWVEYFAEKLAKRLPFVHAYSAQLPCDEAPNEPPRAIVSVLDEPIDVRRLIA